MKVSVPLWGRVKYLTPAQRDAIAPVVKAQLRRARPTREQRAERRALLRRQGGV